MANPSKDRQMEKPRKKKESGVKKQESKTKEKQETTFGQEIWTSRTKVMKCSVLSPRGIDNE